MPAATEGPVPRALLDLSVMTCWRARVWSGAGRDSMVFYKLLCLVLHKCILIRE